MSCISFENKYISKLKKMNKLAFHYFNCIIGIMTIYLFLYNLI